MGRYTKACAGALQGGQDKGSYPLGAHLDDTRPRGFAKHKQGRGATYANAEKEPFS